MNRKRIQRWIGRKWIQRWIERKGYRYGLRRKEYRDGLKGFLVTFRRLLGQEDILIVKARD